MQQELRQILEHNGRQIVLHNYANLEGEALVSAIDQIKAKATQDVTSNRLVLVDVTNVVIDKAVMQAFRKLTADAPGVVDKGAIVGLSGIQMLFFNILKSFSKSQVETFDSRDDALDWLTSR